MRWQPFGDSRMGSRLVHSLMGARSMSIPCPEVLTHHRLDSVSRQHQAKTPDVMISRCKTSCVGPQNKLDLSISHKAQAVW